jgi:hypothetical protein
MRGQMLVSVLLNRGLAEVVTFSAVGNTALAATCHCQKYNV